MKNTFCRNFSIPLKKLKNIFKQKMSLNYFSGFLTSILMLVQEVKKGRSFLKFSDFTIHLTEGNIMHIKGIHVNPHNPRYIRDKRYQKLKKSIKEFPKMMKLRPIIVDDDGKILGGNMRYLAVVDLGYKEIPEGWVVKASELTEEEQKRFVITDNVEFGDFDYDKLANEYEIGELLEWGVDLKEIEEIPSFEENIDESKFNECPKCGYKW